MADIKFLCPSCSRKLAIDERGAGMLVKCPDCATVVTVPHPSTIPAEPKPAPIAPPPAAPAPPAPSRPAPAAPPATPRNRPAPPVTPPAAAPPPVKPPPAPAPPPPAAPAPATPPLAPPPAPPAPDPALEATIRTLTAQRDEQEKARRAAEQEREALRTRLNHAEAALAARTAETTTLQRDHETALAAALETHRIDQERRDTEREAAAAERLRLEAQLAKLTTDYQALSASLDQARQQQRDLETRLTAERDAAREASSKEQAALRRELETERDTALARLRDTDERIERLTAEREYLDAVLKDQRTELNDALAAAITERDAAVAALDTAQREARALADAREAAHQQALAAEQAARQQAIEEARRAERDAAAVALAAEHTARSDAEAALLREREKIGTDADRVRAELAALRQERDTLAAEREAARKVEAVGSDTITTGEARAYRDPFRLLLRRIALYAGGAFTLLGLAAAYIAWTSDEPAPSVLATPSSESLRAVLADDIIEARLGAPALIDELEITIGAPRVGPVTLVSMLGTETESSEWYLVFDVTIVNRSTAETILYQPWSNALITDANKRKLRPALLGQQNAMHDVKDRLVTHTLAPGESITDRMVFPWRETEADHYTLTVDPDARRINLDERMVQRSFSSLRLDLPRTAITFP